MGRGCFTRAECYLWRSRRGYKSCLLGCFEAELRAAESHEDDVLRQVWVQRGASRLARAAELSKLEEEAQREEEQRRLLEMQAARVST